VAKGAGGDRGGNGREKHGGGVLQNKVLVLKLLSVNRLTTGTVSYVVDHRLDTGGGKYSGGVRRHTSSEISSLNHKRVNNTMESTSFVVQRLARLAESLLTSAKGTKVLDDKTRQKLTNSWTGDPKKYRFPSHLSRLGSLVSVQLHHDSTLCMQEEKNTI
jgi:hypothetical protein